MAVGRVIVVGSVNEDLVIAGPRLPQPGETVIGGTFARHHGGKGANQAVAAARLGTLTLFVGAVGDDELGVAAREALESEGVEVGTLSVQVGAATGVALILVATGGENAISVAPGANLLLTPETVADAFATIAPSSADVVLVSNEVPAAVVLAALGLARAAGARTILNPAPAVGVGRDAIALADVLTPNRSELATLLGGAEGDLRAAAIRLLALPPDQPGASAVAVTLGASGALVVERADGATVVSDVPAPAVAAVDTTGAGDAFNGCLAASLVLGLPIGEAVRRAVVAGALATLRPGARAGMPSAAELEAAVH